MSKYNVFGGRHDDVSIQNLCLKSIAGYFFFKTNIIVIDCLSFSYYYVVFLSDVLHHNDCDIVGIKHGDFQGYNALEYGQGELSSR